MSGSMLESSIPNLSDEGLRLVTADAQVRIGSHVGIIDMVRDELERRNGSD